MIEPKAVMIQIKDIVQKTSESGRVYHVAHTDRGAMTIFEAAVAEQLRGKPSARVLMVEINGFKQIRGIDQAYNVEVIPVANSAPLPISTQMQGGSTTHTKTNSYSASPSSEAKKESRGDFPLSMKVSYAKDIYCAFIANKVPEDYEAAGSLATHCCEIVRMMMEEF